MRILEPDRPTDVSREILITIDVPDRYVEIVEMYRSLETGSLIKQIVLFKEMVTRANHRQNP